MACTVYLLHFSRPLGGRVQHYVGQTARPDVMVRVGEHRAGRGSRSTKGAVAAGIELVLARVWENAPRCHEQKLKNRGGFRRLCPVCMELEQRGTIASRRERAMGPTQPRALAT